MTRPHGADDKPFSPACERNREPILAALRPLLVDARSVLEIGSGTGQHAVHFAAALPQLRWQTSDRSENLPGIRQWLDEAGLANTPAPLPLDVGGDWPSQRFDAVFSANTLHIMAWPEVETLFRRLPQVLVDDGLLVIYGPFNRDRRPTSASNAAFDLDLRSRAPHMGLRDLADVDRLAAAAGLARVAVEPMPANNLLVAWRRRAGD
jgi:cyclopropane fatty-acyl-phospholipid synthase-like methyltransferase